MSKLRTIVFLFFLFNSIVLHAQQELCIVDSISYNYVDCYGDSTGSISLTLLDTDPTYPPPVFWWNGPNGFYQPQTLSISNLPAGDYIFTIILYADPLDTNSVICSNLINGSPKDTIKIKQTIKINADFMLKNMCDLNDSADVTSTIWGGTPPYTTLWSNGDTARNPLNLHPNSMIFPDTAHYVIISDKNSCVDTLTLKISSVKPMDAYMSSQGVFCKDDNSGEASIFINGGVGPYSFIWNNDTNSVIINEISSNINSLLPGQYVAIVTDDMGCTIIDSVIVSSDPSICLNIYKVFSPNFDGVNDFWEIENINLYPQAMVLIYDRNGRQVFRRRNYKNEFSVAFSGKDQQGRVLPSGTYYYIIDLENGDNEFKGTVSIVR